MKPAREHGWLLVFVADLALAFWLVSPPGQLSVIVLLAVVFGPPLLIASLGADFALLERLRN